MVVFSASSSSFLLFFISALAGEVFISFFSLKQRLLEEWRTERDRKGSCAAEGRYRRGRFEDCLVLKSSFRPIRYVCVPLYQNHHLAKAQIK
ncbi:hypothetical protein I7I53_05716 [Histoplasma capsulatum var. duboisii H88]|uniref:Uncharacterized protein n=1 Tax=Ajellomyces capsulatus (strain H88) TaxID=544711 RepID=A0A8A1LXY4_AJEC8|nr:hypothetical protein I7I53_05716 [Histoplasma capsulatum var. duboisii H88]